MRPMPLTWPGLVVTAIMACRAVALGSVVVAEKPTSNESRGGQERRIGEGTWGTDYTGFVIPKKTNLLWWHGQRYQGGVGSYRTDGPRIVHKP